MAAYFFDSSAIVKRYVAESGTAWVSSLTDVEAGNKVYGCRIAFVEVISAIMRRSRTSDLSSPEAMKAIADFRYDFSQEYSLIEISPTLVGSAGDLAEAHALRAYDAVQLAAALEIWSELNSVSSAMTLNSADAASTLPLSPKDLQYTTRTLILRNRSKEVNELRSNKPESRLTKTLVSGHRRCGDEFRSVHKVLGVGKASRG